MNHDNDSDIDPNDMKPDHDILPSGGGAVNPTQVQLNPAQVEEAKQVTYGKLKQFRRDRLHQSDRERQQFLQDYLKKSRVMDDQNVFNIGFNNYGTSPNRTSQNKNYDHNRGSSPSKISPNKTSGGPTKAVNDNSHSNNGQVMTQISAIYAKRSRSYLNQFNQTNNPAGGNYNMNHNHASQ